MMRVHLLSIAAFVSLLVLSTQHAASNTQQNAAPSLTTAVTKAIEDAVDKLIAYARRGAACEIMIATFRKFSNRGVFAEHPFLKLRVKDDKNIKLFDLAPKGVNLPILLDSMTYKCSSKDFTVDTRASGRQIIIPGVMEIENVMISLAVNLKDPNSLVVTFRGKWAITNEADVDVTVVYRKSTGNFNIIAEPSGVSVNFVPLLTRLNLPNPFGKELSFDSFLVSGLITSDSTVTLLIREDSHHKKIYLIYNKPAQGAAQKAIAADFPKVRLSSLVSKLEGADISRVPYFGSLTAPEIGFTVSKAEITELPDDTFAESELIKQITSDGSTIKKGTRAAMKLMNTTIIIQDQKFTPLPPGLTVSNLISVIPGIDFNGIPMPFDFGLLQNIAISSFTIAESKEKSVVVGVDYKKNLNFFNNLIAIRNAKITLSLSEKPTKVRVAASGIMRVGRTEFAVKLFTNKKKKYVLQATAETFPISSAMSQFQAKALPPELNSLLSKIPFLNFTIKKPRLTFPLSSKPKQIQIGGIPVVAGYNIVSTDVIILKGVSQTNIIEGFDLRSVNLANLLHSISGLVFNRIAILNQDIEAAIVISPVTLPGIRLHGKKLKDFSIVKGISIQAAMGYPANCASDAFCAVAQYLLEDSTINLRGTMQSANSFRLFAGVSQISVGSGLVIRDAGVEVNAGAQTSIGITGSIVLRNPPITLTSKIFLSTSGVVLQMTMSGCWKNAFGAKWLTICSIIGSVGMAPGVPLTSLELGGEIRLGKPQCSAPIIAKGFFGIDAITPTNNYYYVQFTGRTTLGSLLQAFCVGISLPRVLGESGFPRGFLSSYSIAGRHLPHARLNIPNGFRLKGTFNILGLVGSADITISLPKGINCYVALPPINVGKGLLKMTRSSKDSSHGPYLRSNILLLPSPKIDIAASGFLQVLGISLSSTLRITNTYYRYTISGRMLHLFHAELVLTARYGSISRASFRVRGTFKNDIFDAIENKIEGALKSSSDKATHEINKARGKVNEQHAKFNRAVRHLKSAEGQVNRAKSSFRSAEKKLRSAHDRINRVCSIRSCGRQCIPCVRGFKCCKKIWGKCVCKRPRFNSCCRRITDPVCATANKACEGLKATARTAIKAAEGVLRGARHSLRVAQGALRAAQGTVNAARVSLHAANAVLRAASTTYRVGSDAASKISRFGLNGLIAIRRMTFDVNLKAANGGSFTGSARIRFFGQAEITVHLHINLRDVTAMAKQLADRIGKGFSSLF